MKAYSGLFAVRMNVPRIVELTSFHHTKAKPQHLGLEIEFLGGCRTIAVTDVFRKWVFPSSLQPIRPLESLSTAKAVNRGIL